MWFHAGVTMMYDRYPKLIAPCQEEAKGFGNKGIFWQRKQFAGYTTPYPINAQENFFVFIFLLCLHPKT